MCRKENPPLEDRRERNQPWTVTWLSMGVACWRMDLIATIMVLWKLPKDRKGRPNDKTPAVFFLLRIWLFHAPRMLARSTVALNGLRCSTCSMSSVT
jgi:hypothetical protein